MPECQRRLGLRRHPRHDPRRPGTPSPSLVLSRRKTWLIFRSWSKRRSGKRPASLTPRQLPARRGSRPRPVPCRSLRSITPQGHRRASCGISAGWGPVGDLEEKASDQVNGRERRAGGIVCKAAPYWPRARLAGSVLLAARLSWPSPSSQGQAAARSLREPGHGGHGQGRAATRSTGEMQGTQSSPNHSRWPPLGA
jgi:hypothetical protein